MLAIPVDSIVGGVMTGVRAEEKKNMRRPTTVFFLVSVIKYFLWGGKGGLGGFAGRVCLFVGSATRIRCYRRHAYSNTDNSPLRSSRYAIDQLIT